MYFKVSIPDFPGRKFFGSTNSSDDGIKKRAFELQTYFEDLLLVEKIRNLPIVQDYLPIKVMPTPGCMIRLSIERY